MKRNSSFTFFLSCSPARFRSLEHSSPASDFDVWRVWWALLSDHYATGWSMEREDTTHRRRRKETIELCGWVLVTGKRKTLFVRSTIAVQLEKKLLISLCVDDRLLRPVRMGNNSPSGTFRSEHVVESLLKTWNCIMINDTNLQFTFFYSLFLCAFRHRKCGVGTSLH